MPKKSTTAAPVESEKLPVIKAPTKFTVQLGDQLHTIFFGTNAFIRIHEGRPSLTSAFNVMEEMAAIEAIPFLIDCGIRPEDKTWKDYEAFLEIYDECDDTEAIAKVLPGYLSACGSILKKLTPALAALEALSEKATK